MRTSFLPLVRTYVQSGGSITPGLYFFSDLGLEIYDLNTRTNSVLKTYANLPTGLKSQPQYIQQWGNKLVCLMSLTGSGTNRTLGFVIYDLITEGLTSKNITGINPYSASGNIYGFCIGGDRLAYAHRNSSDGRPMLKILNLATDVETNLLSTVSLSTILQGTSAMAANPVYSETYNNFSFVIGAGTGTSRTGAMLRFSTTAFQSSTSAQSWSLEIHDPGYRNVAEMNILGDEAIFFNGKPSNSNGQQAALFRYFIYSTTAPTSLYSGFGFFLQVGSASGQYIYNRVTTLTNGTVSDNRIQNFTNSFSWSLNINDRVLTAKSLDNGNLVVMVRDQSNSKMYIRELKVVGTTTSYEADIDMGRKFELYNAILIK